MKSSEKMISRGIGGRRSFEKPLKQSLNSLRAVIRHYIENTRIVYGNPYLEENDTKLQEYVTNATSAALESIITDICDSKILDVDVENHKIVINSDRIEFMDCDVFDLIPLSYIKGCDSITPGTWLDVFDRDGNRLATIVYSDSPDDEECASYYGYEANVFHADPEGNPMSLKDIECINNFIFDHGGTTKYNEGGQNDESE